MLHFSSLSTHRRQAHPCSSELHSFVGRELSFLQARYCLVILFPLLTSHISFSHLSSHSRHLLFRRSSLSKYLQVGPLHGQVSVIPQSIHFTIVTTCSCSTHLASLHQHSHPYCSFLSFVPSSLQPLAFSPQPH